MTNIVVIANIKVKKEFKGEVYNELLKLHQATNANDKGCIQYELHRNLDDVDSFTFIETWESADLLNAHTKQEHFMEFNKNIENKLESFNLTKLEKV